MFIKAVSGQLNVAPAVLKFWAELVQVRIDVAQHLTQHPEIFNRLPKGYHHYLCNSLQFMIDNRITPRHLIGPLRSALELLLRVKGYS
jgi:hypothetical protein